MKQSDQRATMAIGEPMVPSEPKTVIVGIPDTAWFGLDQGGTMTFDLRHAGVRAQLIIFRARDGAHVAELLGQSQALLDGAPIVAAEELSRQ